MNGKKRRRKPQRHTDDYAAGDWGCLLAVLFLLFWLVAYFVLTPV